MARIASERLCEAKSAKEAAVAERDVALRIVNDLQSMQCQVSHGLEALKQRLLPHVNDGDCEDRPNTIGSPIPPSLLVPIANNETDPGPPTTEEAIYSVTAKFEHLGLHETDTQQEAAPGFECDDQNSVANADRHPAPGIAAEEALSP